MQLETKLRRLAALLPARQQTLEFLGDSIWNELPQGDQRACRQAIANLLLEVLQDESDSASYDHSEEEDDHE